MGSLHIFVQLSNHHGYRIIIIIQMSLVEAGSLVGGVIGSPVSLDMKKVDGAPPPSTSRPPQQPALMGGGGATAPPARAAPPLAIKGPNSAPTQGGWGYNGSAATNR